MTTYFSKILIYLFFPPKLIAMHSKQFICLETDADQISIYIWKTHILYKTCMCVCTVFPPCAYAGKVILYWDNGKEHNATTALEKFIVL